MPFLRNAWYVASWSEALGASPTRIQVLGEWIALYRTEAGVPMALGDRCPHRFASLSQGKVCGDALQCPYHGLRFSPAGQCVLNPHGNGAIPPRAHVRAYPLVEKHHALWIWMGETERADPAAIPDFSWYDGGALASSRGYLRIDSDYRLVIDNLLDLSHAALLHPFLATPEFLSRTRTRVEVKGDDLWCYRWNDDEPITPLFQLVWDRPEPRGDMRSHMRWNAPSNLLLDVGVTRCGGTPEEGPALPSAHLLTPATETSTHYFWMVGRNRRHDDAELGAIIHGGIERAFTTEDEPMITRVAANMNGADFWSLRPVTLPDDAAGVRARQMLDERIGRESGLEKSQTGT